MAPPLDRTMMFRLLRPLSLPLLLAVSSAAETASAEFEGAWLGTVTAPQATAEIGFAFRRTERGLAATLHMPAMFMHGAAVGRAQPEADGSLRCAGLDTRLRREGDRLTGTFGLSHLPLELRRIDALPVTRAAPPATPTRAAPAPRWSVSLGAELWATPVVRDETIYVGAADGKLHALDATKGRVRWSWQGEHGLFARALATETHVFVVDAGTQLVAVRRADGGLAWRTALHDAAIAGALKPNATFNHRTATPVLRDGTLFLGSTDGGLYAIDAATGRVQWRHEAKSAFHATATLDGGLLWIGGHDGTLLGFDLATRAEVSRTRLPGPISAAPVIAGDHVVVGCRDYTLYGLRRSDLTVAWRHTFWFSWIESEPALVDGTLYIGGSDYARISALDPATGRARWATIVNGLTWGTPLVTDSVVYAGTSAQAGALLPHVGAFVALDRKTGAIMWRHDLPLAPPAKRAGVIGSPLRSSGQVVIATFDGAVTAFPIEP